MTRAPLAPAPPFSPRRSRPARRLPVPAPMGDLPPRLFFLPTATCPAYPTPAGPLPSLEPRPLSQGRSPGRASAPARDFPPRPSPPAEPGGTAPGRRTFGLARLGGGAGLDRESVWAALCSPPSLRHRAGRGGRAGSQPAPGRGSVPLRSQRRGTQGSRKRVGRGPGVQESDHGGLGRSLTSRGDPERREGRGEEAKQTDGLTNRDRGGP